MMFETLKVGNLHFLREYDGNGQQVVRFYDPTAMDAPEFLLADTFVKQLKVWWSEFDSVLREVGRDWFELSTADINVQIRVSML